MVSADDSPPLTIEKDGTEFDPPVVSQIQANAVAQDERVTDLCGNVETRQVADARWQLDIEGLMLHSDKVDLEDLQLQGEYATITQDVVRPATFYIKDVTITRTAETNTAEFPFRDGKERVYEFAIQTRDPTNDEGAPQT
jgi:hypothetical protein